jgi:hypothetical protein
MHLYDMKKKGFMVSMLSLFGSMVLNVEYFLCWILENFIICYPIIHQFLLTVMIASHCVCVCVCGLTRVRTRGGGGGGGGVVEKRNFYI